MMIPSPKYKFLNNREIEPTSVLLALLQMINTLPPVALVHLIAHQARHHAANPLLAQNSILRSLERNIVVEVDALEGRGDLGLSGKESFGLGGRHCGGVERGDFVGDVGVVASAN